MAYEKGELGLVTDEEEALKWYKMAAEVGNGYAQRRLGVAYTNRKLGVEIDLEAARTYFQEAA